MSGEVDARVLQQVRRVRALHQQQQQQHQQQHSQFDDVVHVSHTARSPVRSNASQSAANASNHHLHYHHHHDDAVDDVLVREFALLDERQRRLRLHESAAAKELIFREMAAEGFQKLHYANAKSAAAAAATPAVAPVSAVDELHRQRHSDVPAVESAALPDAAAGDEADAAPSAEFELFGRRFVVPNVVMPDAVSDVVRRLREWQRTRRAGTGASSGGDAGGAVPPPTSEWFDDSRALRERLAVLLPPEVRPHATAISSDSLSVNDAPVLLLAELNRLLRSVRNCGAHRAQLRALLRRLEVIRTRLASAPHLDSNSVGGWMYASDAKRPALGESDDASAEAFVGLIVDVTLAMLEHVELALISEFPRLGMAEERLCHLRHVLERASMESAYTTLIHHFASAVSGVDSALATRYADLRSALPGHLGVRPRFWLLDTKRLAPYRLAIGLLRLLPVCETPDAKLRCLLNAQTAVTTEVNDYWRSRLPHLADRAAAGGDGGGGGGGDDAAAAAGKSADALVRRGCAPTRLPIRLAGDDLLPLLSYIVLQARVPHLYAHLSFAADFLARRRRGDAEGYCVVLFRSVAEYVSTLDENALEKNIEEIRDELDQAAAPARRAPVPPAAKTKVATLEFDDAEFSEQILPPVRDDDDDDS